MKQRETRIENEIILIDLENSIKHEDDRIFTSVGINKINIHLLEIKDQILIDIQHLQAERDHSGQRNTGEDP